VIHEKKIFEDLSKFSLFCPLLDPKRVQTLYLNKSELPSPNKRPKGPVTLTWFSNPLGFVGFFSTKFYIYLVLAIMEQFKIPYLCKL